jgi:hypothetical protein
MGDLAGVLQTAVSDRSGPVLVELAAALRAPGQSV